MLQRLFANPEKKFKILAVVVLILFAAIGVIMGLSVGLASGSFILGLLVGILMFALYGIVGFICGLYLFMYAEVLESLKKTAKSTKRSADMLEQIAATVDRTALHETKSEVPASEPVEGNQADEV